MDLAAGAGLAVELTLLGWSVLLLFVHIAVQGATTLAESGVKWNAGPRDGWEPPKSRYAGRSWRALQNFKETYPVFLALVLALAFTGRTGGIAELGAFTWFLARIAYLPLYVFGVPWLRSAAYGVSAVGLLLMLYALLAS